MNLLVFSGIESGIKIVLPSETGGSLSLSANCFTGHFRIPSEMPFFFHFLAFLRRQFSSVLQQPLSVASSSKNPKSAIIGVKTGVKFKARSKAENTLTNPTSLI